MESSDIAYWLAWVGTLAWGVCFGWMHRISSRQDRLLNELHAQARRIAELNELQSDILNQVRPNVDRIREHVATVADGLDQTVEKVDQAATTVERVGELVTTVTNGRAGAT